MFPPAKLSDYLSVLAVILSAISLYISYRNYRRDASRLKIRLNFIDDPVRGGCYTVRITNVGRRPASITHVYAHVDNGKRYPVKNETILLGETEFMDLLVPMAGFKNRPPSAIRAFEIEDSSGKVYTARTWQVWWRFPGLRKPEKTAR